MNEQAFLQALSEKAKDLHINPFLLLSGIEGIYTFREMPLTEANMGFLDSLILTLFTLRIGDQFHALAEEGLASGQDEVRLAAAGELTPIPDEELAATTNPYLASFAGVMQGKAPIRRYHEKALEAAALEINGVQLRYASASIGTIMIGICKTELSDLLDPGTFFSS
ncbi:hypothetical protein [Flaviaesturariibacter amylovorans]|uniref:Uncharacterized protein n=1 Tax=Flaviaesturariibacter amylovorans TaxID=1084520 RepID=A0ABP8H2B9_9BACT